MSEWALNLIHSHDIRWMDLRLTDMKWKEQHVSIAGGAVDEDFFTDGKMFDGSSISRWKRINKSDMIPIPDDSTAPLDPFTNDPTLIERCDIVEPCAMQCCDPRCSAPTATSAALPKKAGSYLASTGEGDTAFFGQEPEFLVFDDVKWDVDMIGAGYAINAEEETSPIT